MSTAGSGPDREAGANTPASTPSEAAPRKRPGLFRWRGIIPLVVILALVTVGWVLFSDLLLEHTTEEAATKLLGTEVDLGAFHLHELAPAIDLRGLQVADPLDSMRNLVEAGELIVDLDPSALLQKKLVIRRFSLQDVRVGTKRRTPAHHVSAGEGGGGFVPGALQAVRQWANQFKVPLLRLTPIDTIRSIVLDPTQLTTVRQALALKAQADSVQGVLTQGYQGLALQQTLDSAQAVAKRLQGAKPLQLGVAGTKRAVDDVKRTIDQINQARARVGALERTARSSIALLDTGVHALDEARRTDYAFAKGLLKLPTFEAPEIGSALFGHVTIDRFQQALYWAELARKYMPPGLLPHPTPGPKRLRMAGMTVHFAREATYPDFLLERGDVSFTINGKGPTSGRYAAAIENLTSAPALVGKPTAFALRREDDGKGGIALAVRGLIDHTDATPHESLVINAAHFPLPSFDLPGLPFRADPRQGAVDLTFEHSGDRIAGTWTVRSNQVAWLTDSTSSTIPTPLLPAVTSVVEGLTQLDLTARVSGTLTSPNLSVSSNLDRALADRLRAVAGQEVARAEARARAAVDSVVDEKTKPVVAQVTALRTEADRRVADAKARLDAEKKKLEDTLKSLTGGIIGLPKFNGARLD